MLSPQASRIVCRGISVPDNNTVVMAELLSVKSDKIQVTFNPPKEVTVQLPEGRSMAVTMLPHNSIADIVTALGVSAVCSPVIP